MSATSSTAWTNLRTKLETKYAIIDHGHDLLRLRHHETTLGVRRRDTMVETTAKIRGVRTVDYANALVLTAELTEGSLCVMGGGLFVRHLIPLAVATHEDLVTAFSALARIARMIGPRVNKSIERFQTLEHFAD